MIGIEEDVTLATLEYRVATIFILPIMLLPSDCIFANIVVERFDFRSKDQSEHLLSRERATSFEYKTCP